MSLHNQTMGRSLSERLAHELGAELGRNEIAVSPSVSSEGDVTVLLASSGEVDSAMGVVLRAFHARVVSHDGSSATLEVRLLAPNTLTLVRLRTEDE